MKWLIALLLTFSLSPITELANPPTIKTEIIQSVSHREVECLAKNIFFEARGESTVGKIAVAAVTVNRVGLQGFSNSICGVVYQATTRLNKTLCQFSWVCQPQRARLSGDSWEESKQVAFEYLAGHHKDPTYGSLFYHATYINPKWPHQHKITIGKHKYYGA